MIIKILKNFFKYFTCESLNFNDNRRNMTHKKPKLKKRRQTPEQKELSFRYKCAWNHLFSKLGDWVKKMIIQDPKGRYADELATETAKLAESNRSIPPYKND